jgi:hypothetical protein
MSLEYMRVGFHPYPYKEIARGAVSYEFLLVKRATLIVILTNLAFGRNPLLSRLYFPLIRGKGALK